MGSIRKLSPDRFKEFAETVSKAYPGWKAFSAADIQRIADDFTANDAAYEDYNLYGCFRDGDDKLLGGMILFDYTMNLFSVLTPVGGVGMVAVDLMHKKEKVAKELIIAFCRHYRERGTKLAALYPFRPDFYRKMGFGYGTKGSQYKVRPADLPAGPSKEGLRFLTLDDKDAMKACYDRYALQTHGMFLRTNQELAVYDKSVATAVGFEKDGVLRGYLRFLPEQYEPSNFGANHLVLREFVYETPEALQGLLTFLNSQSDQYQRVIFNTQDENLHFLFRDPRNGSDRLSPPVVQETNSSGISMMYRVLDVPGVFDVLKDHDFGGETLRVKLNVRDTLLPETACTVVLQAERGQVRVVEEGDYDVEATMDIADFSSVLLGSADVKGLYRLGLIELSDETHLTKLHRMFRVDDKPITMSAF